MEALKIKSTQDTPEIIFDPKNDQFQIIGNSIPENAVSYYEPIILWLRMYSENPNRSTELVFKMNILNTSSTKMFMLIFKEINHIAEKSDVHISWYYDFADDDLQELGVDFKTFTAASFELIPE